MNIEITQEEYEDIYGEINKEFIKQKQLHNGN
jgi:hypothetical protein